MNTQKLSFLVLVLAVCLTQFATDIYAPALPAIATSLQAPLSSLQLTMAIYMLGVALSQLVYGPVSEVLGRKTPMAFGLALMLVGSSLCVVANHVTLLLVGRVLQGCGAGACAALWRTVFRDMFSGEELAKYTSYLVIFIMFIVPAAPLLGGYLVHYWGWRANFIFMLCYGVVALIAFLLAFKETKQQSASSLKFSHIVSNFRTLLMSRIFMGMTACTFLAYGAFFAWFTSGPIVLIHQLGISPVQFGWLVFFGGGIPYALAGWLNGRLVTRFGMPTLLRAGFTLMVIAGLVMLITSYFVGVNLWGIMLPVSLFYFGSTFIWPNAYATAFTPFGAIAGYAGALYGFMQIAGAAIMGGLMAYLPAHNQDSLAWVMMATAIIAWLIYEYCVVSNLKTK